MKRISLSLLILSVFLLHQDFWNWKNSGLVLGFLPVGLAYHAAYAAVAACVMAVLVKFAWPAELEQMESSTHQHAKSAPNDERRNP